MQKRTMNSKLLLIGVALMICLVVSLNFMHSCCSRSTASDHLQPSRSHDLNRTDVQLQKQLKAATFLMVKKDEEIRKLQLKYEQKSTEIEQLKNQLDATKQKLKQCSSNEAKPTDTNQISIPIYRTKPLSINTFWWPSVQGGGLLQKIHALQHPTNCTSRDTRYFVWLSGPEPWLDKRGLTAWGHTFMKQLMHALTDGDQFQEYGSRVLVQDDQLWPMAKGCTHGPETRECYFQPLSSCNFSNADAFDLHSKKVHILQDKPDEEYNRTVRTLYMQSSWWRTIHDSYSWTGSPGDEKSHSEVAIVAAVFAYYFNPKPWLRDEINERLQKSIPADLDPDKTIGVPIRRSDKCSCHELEGSAPGEMKCHPLETYLDGVKSLLQFDPLVENIIVTSEDRSACNQFIALLKNDLPMLRVIVNVGDVQQGTGSGSRLESYSEGTSNADVIASALTSLHMHLRARYFVITSKSSWTSTIALMARVYGFATSDVSVIDIESNHNGFANLAKRGCSK